MIPNKWKLFHDGLRPEQNRRIRGLGSIFCSLFGYKEEETRKHVFHDCGFTQRIWVSSNLGNKVEASRGVKREQWLRNWVIYLVKIDGHERNLITQFICSLWSVGCQEISVYLKTSKQIRNVHLECIVMNGTCTYKQYHSEDSEACCKRTKPDSWHTHIVEEYIAQIQRQL